MNHHNTSNIGSMNKNKSAYSIQKGPLTKQKQTRIYIDKLKKTLIHFEGKKRLDTEKAMRDRSEHYKKTDMTLFCAPFDLVSVK